MHFHGFSWYCYTGCLTIVSEDKALRDSAVILIGVSYCLHLIDDVQFTNKLNREMRKPLVSLFTVSDWAAHSSTPVCCSPSWLYALC